jgi:hypothetical protein
MLGRIVRLGLLFLLMGAPAWAAPAEEAPPIREFDIATIEQLGREMYAQDQEAWKATDLLFARISQDDARRDKIHGWITEMRGVQEVVRFVHETDHGPEAYYDISFAGVAPPVLSVPQNRTLTPEELSQHNARRTAISAATLNCSSTYNSVALKDPQGDGWLVWVMAATKDPDALMMGGHQRFTISKDGKTILRRDALSRDCIQFSRKDDKGGGHMILSHVVSLTPVETHVFASLSYRIGFYLGTPDGRTWRIADGHIAGVDPDMAGFDGVAARMMAGQAEDCHMLATKAGKLENVGAVQVAVPTENAGKFTITPPAGAKVSSIICNRNSLIPLPNDYKVLLAGYTLGIADRGAGHPDTLAVIEIVNGRFQLRMIDGTMSADQQSLMEKRLNQLQSAFNAEIARR